MSEGKTAVCRHDGCGKRFTLSRYGNRTHTSERRRKRHQFCCDAHRKAHSRRLKRLEAWGERTQQPTPGLSPTIVTGERTEAKVDSKSPCKTGTFEVPQTPKITTLDPPLVPREWLQVHFKDEARAIGSGLRLIAVERITARVVRNP